MGKRSDAPKLKKVDMDQRYTDTLGWRQDGQSDEESVHSIDGDEKWRKAQIHWQYYKQCQRPLVISGPSHSFPATAIASRIGTLKTAAAVVYREQHPDALAGNTSSSSPSSCHITAISSYCSSSSRRGRWQSALRGGWQSGWQSRLKGSRIAHSRGALQ